jgi:HPt (histidine-containing phosphotransfer) domain-containing protein
MQHFDLSILRDMAAGDEEFVQTILQMSLEDIPVALENIKEALANHEWDRVYQHAHKIKPTLQTLGVRSEVWDNLLVINDCSKNKKNLDELPSRVELFLTDVQLMIDDLAKLNK